MLNDTISQTLSISVHKRHHSALSTALCRLGNCRRNDAPTIVASAAGWLEIRSLNKQASLSQCRHAPTPYSNDHTGNFALWRFRFRVGQPDEKHPQHLISQHLSAVVSVAQHIRRAATLSQYPTTQPDHKVSGHGDWQTATNGWRRGCSCWGAGLAFPIETRLPLHNHMMSRVQCISSPHDKQRNRTAGNHANE
jgi:hypothetical protein